MTRARLKKRGLRPGFTMFETFGVLLVGAALMAGANMLINMALDFLRTSDLERAVTALSLQVKGHYAALPSYKGLDNDVAKKMGMVPKQILKGDKIQTPWGGDITLAADTSGSGADSDRFSIKVEKLSESVCLSLATYQPDGWADIKIGAGGASLVDPTGDMTVMQKASGSGGCAVGNTNVLTFIDR